MLYTVRIDDEKTTNRYLDRAYADKKLSDIFYDWRNHDTYVTYKGTFGDFWREKKRLRGRKHFKVALGIPAMGDDMEEV